MRRNVHQAVGIIAALSLLLGLSLGQLQEKHRIIEDMKGHSPRRLQMMITPKSYEAHFHRYRCDDQFRRARMHELRARIEAERARMDEERAKVLEEINRANQSIGREKAHVILREEL